MQLSKISRSYKQTIETKTKSGSTTWISHEAMVEAEIDENDAPRLRECYSELEAIAKAEVIGALKKAKAAALNPVVRVDASRSMPKL